MKKRLLLPICLIGPMLSILAQQPQEAMPLWQDGKVPGAHGSDPIKDIPTLTPFWPAAEQATGAAMIICPGGGYKSGISDASKLLPWTLDLNTWLKLQRFIK